MIRSTRSPKAAILLAALALGGEAAAIAAPADLQSDRVTIAYDAPQDGEQGAIFDALRQRRVLEAFRAYLAPLRLPRVLRLRTAGCDGQANAWYDEEEEQITVCYEYLAEAWHHAPARTTDGEVGPDDAVLGPGIYVFLHESAHALFHLLEIPILGREEDAADQVAVYLMLHLAADMPRRTIAAVVRMYHRDAQAHPPDRSDLADVHGLSEQRVYNILCLAYGSDPVQYADVLSRGYLPPERAESCAAEYLQIDRAVTRLIKPYLDDSLLKQGRPRDRLRDLQGDGDRARDGTPR